MNNSRYWGDKKKICIACYTFLLSFGLLSLWTTFTKPLAYLLTFFSPLYYSLAMIIVLTYLALQSIKKVLLILGYLLSIFVISMVGFPVLQLVWNEELLLGFIHLFAFGSSFGLIILKQSFFSFKKFILPIVYSILFLLLALISGAIPSMYRELLMILVLGQGLALCLAYCYATFFDKEVRLAERKYTQVKLERTTRYMKNGGVQKTTSLFLFILAYVVLLVSSWYYLSQLFQFITLLILFIIFSLFLLAALANSLSHSFRVHSVLIFSSIPLCLLSVTTNFLTDEQLLLGVLLFFGAGVHLLIYRVYVHENVHASTHLQAHIIFLAAFFTFMHDWSYASTLKAITFIFVVTYFLLHLIGFILSSLGLRVGIQLVNATGKRRVSVQHNHLSKAKIEYEIHIGESESERKMLQLEEERGHISASEREKQLALYYHQWLLKKSQKMELDFLQKDD